MNWFIEMHHQPGMRGVLVLLYLNILVVIGLWLAGYDDTARLLGTFGPFLGLGYGAGYILATRNR